MTAFSRLSPTYLPKQVGLHLFLRSLTTLHPWESDVVVTSTRGAAFSWLIPEFVAHEQSSRCEACLMQDHEVGSDHQFCCTSQAGSAWIGLR